MIYDLIIVGGGASGISLAIKYKELNKNKKFLILERNKELLRKLNVTGNGKCNFTNDLITYKNYNNGEFFKDIILNSSNNVKDFFNSLNIKYFKDSENRIYPLSKSSKAVSEIMISKLNKDEYLLETLVTDIKKKDDIFEVFTNDNKYLSKRLVIAIGNKNYSTLGSDLSLKNVIESLGHSFTELYPSDIYIKVKNKDITKRLTGLRFYAKLSLYNDNKLVYSEKGELLFKDDALSGIVTFNVSSRLAYLYKKSRIKNPYILVDYLDGIHLENVDVDSKNKLLGMLNEKLVDVLLYNKNNIIDNIHSMKFDLLSLGDFSHAQVTSGGIKSNEVNNLTLESNIVKGLYFLGDILDIDAPCGGYNLTFAINSGLTVGKLL